MANPINPHDKFFRSLMQNAPVSQEFFEYHLPAPMLDALDINSFKLESNTYIDEKLQETLSDLVFTCHYKKGHSDSEAKIFLLVEHQSSPHRLMPYRVYHYLFNMLYSELKSREKEHGNDKLPAVYAMVFYHGKQTPYPYSMRLEDCFDDPLGLMNDIFTEPVPLIDVNLISDEELERQRLLGIMTGALKRSRDRDMGRHLIRLLERLNLLDLSDHLALNFVRTVSNYMLSVGNIDNIEQFIEGGQRLPERVKGEFMTAAEKLKAWGAEEALEEVAINLLKDGAEPNFVARMVKLELATVLRLQAELEQE